MAANARSFTRPDNEVITSLGSVGQWLESTVVAMVKTTDTTNTKVVLSAGNTNAWTFQVDADESVAFFSDGGGGIKRNSAASRVVSGRWHIIGVCKAAGTTTPRFHIYDYTALSWVHEDGGGTSPNNTGTPAGPSTCWIGQDNNSSGAGWQGEIQALAWWNSQLSDGTVETLVPSKTAWLTASPAAMWVLNQSVTTDDVLDEIGTADETGLTGTSVTTGNPDWDDGVDEWPPDGSEDSPRTIIQGSAPRLR